mmetsp:Transcript_19885/g.28333  ORF Transcript_19885/g.28333 Transcript_19885/m.28333 type:complete len:335 (+) Transcript_19885:44-1048(+)
MKLSISTTCIVALATFLAAVFPADASSCDSITDARESFEYAAVFLNQIPGVNVASQLFTDTLNVVENLECAVDILTAADVTKIAKCLIRENDLEGLQFGLDSLASSMSSNKLPTPGNLNEYAEDAQDLEAAGASIGYQAALLNVDSAVIKLAMFTSKSISLELSLEDGDEVNNAKGQAVAGVEKSLEYMKELEDDLDSILADGPEEKTKSRGKCTRFDKVPCIDVERPFCEELICVEWEWELKLSYWCNSETFTYSTEARIVSNGFIDSKINETEWKIKNKFFPNQYHDVKEELKAQKEILCASLQEKKADCEYLADVCHCKEEKKNNSFGAEL